MTLDPIRLDEAVRRADAWSEAARKAAAEARRAGSARELATSVNAPSHAGVRETGGAHGGGSIEYAQKASHADIHKNLTGAGFHREASKASNQSHKMGRTQAYTSTKVQNSSYSHPHGHTATVKTNTSKYSEYGPTSYVDIHRHPGDESA